MGCCCSCFGNHPWVLGYKTLNRCITLSVSEAEAKIGHVGLFVGRIMLIADNHLVCPVTKKPCSFYKYEFDEIRHDEGPGGEPNNMRHFGIHEEEKHSDFFLVDDKGNCVLVPASFEHIPVHIGKPYALYHGVDRNTKNNFLQTVITKAHEKNTSIQFFEEMWCENDVLAVFGKCTEVTNHDGQKVTVLGPVTADDINESFNVENRYRFSGGEQDTARRRLENDAIIATQREDAIKKHEVGVLPLGYQPNNSLCEITIDPTEPKGEFTILYP